MKFLSFSIFPSLFLFLKFLIWMLIVSWQFLIKESWIGKEPREKKTRLAKYSFKLAVSFLGLWQRKYCKKREDSNERSPSLLAWAAHSPSPWKKHPTEWNNKESTMFGEKHRQSIPFHIVLLRKWKWSSKMTNHKTKSYKPLAAVSIFSSVRLCIGWMVVWDGETGFIA